MEGDAGTNVVNLLLGLLCLGLPIAVNGAFTALVVWGAVWWSKRGAPAAAGKSWPAATPAGDPAAGYLQWVPTKDRVREWSEAMMAKPLGGEIEAELKMAIDRALGEELFNRFGDSFTVQLRVSCFHVVQPIKEAAQEIWNAAIKRSIDVLICDRWTLEPVMGFMLWLGEGEPPRVFIETSEALDWRGRHKLGVREWEQVIAVSLLMSVGIPVILISRERAGRYIEKPKMLVEVIEPALADYKERVTAIEVAQAQ